MQSILSIIGSQTRFALGLLVAAFVVGFAVPTPSAATPLYHISFENAQGDYSLVNHGTVGGVATLKHIHGTAITSSSETVSVSPATQAWSSYFAPQGEGNHEVTRSMFELPDSTNRLHIDSHEDTMTITAWVNHDGLQTNPGGIVGKLANNDRSGWAFKISPDNKLQMQQGGHWGQTVTSEAAIPLDQWIHVAVTVGARQANDSRPITLYVNGQLAGSGSHHLNNAGGYNPNAPYSDQHEWVDGNYVPNDDEEYGFIRIGSANWWGQLYGTYVDDVRIYDRVLSVEEIGGIMVPEPASIGFLGIGGLVLLSRRRKTERGA
jgi:hypothetical protein